MPFDGRLLSGVTVLAAVVEAGSMTRAAGALGLTSSGVGRAIQRLEARVGVRLLDRTTRSLRLSEEGARFYARVRPMLDGIEDAALDAAGSAARVRGTLRVNVDPFFSRLVLAQELADFIDQHSELRLELVMRDNVAELVADGYDLAIRFGDPPMGRLVARKLLETRILTVASPAYLARAGRPAHPSDLAGHQCIDYRDPLSGRPFE
ncbi:MAG: LysR family transcriptional regulator, partial [Rhodospirillales bacterium]|nr:LysR family transcriptional regulator [Rhodospirillales bacterium]